MTFTKTFTEDNFTECLLFKLPYGVSSTKDLPIQVREQTRGHCVFLSSLVFHEDVIFTVEGNRLLISTTHPKYLGLVWYIDDNSTVYGKVENNILDFLKTATIENIKHYNIQDMLYVLFCTID